jgi:tetraacyldisaccharide 4'-kinase
MKFLVDAWYQKSPWLICLKPLSCVFQYLAARRRLCYQSGKKTIWKAPVPLLVVGNITVGGVGKTPLVVALVEALSAAGFSPGIVSRGYGGRASRYPVCVNFESKAKEVGDEPLMLAQRTECPVVVDPDRVAAAQYLLAHYQVDVIVSDDGLQHYALGRDLEIAVVDGARGLGNGWCLPAGPLREPPGRLSEVDWVVVNGGQTRITGHCHFMKLTPEVMVNLRSGEVRQCSDIIGQGEVHAIAGIGNPERFFATLEGIGYRAEPHRFDDHADYNASDLQFQDDKPVIMTEKDAVKCKIFAKDNCWYLKVKATLPPEFIKDVLLRVQNCSRQ